MKIDVGIANFSSIGISIFRLNVITVSFIFGLLSIISFQNNVLYIMAENAYEEND